MCTPWYAVRAVYFVTSIQKLIGSIILRRWNAYNVYHHQLLYYADEILLINDFPQHTFSANPRFVSHTSHKHKTAFNWAVAVYVAEFSIKFSIFALTYHGHKNTHTHTHDTQFRYRMNGKVLIIYMADSLQNIYTHTHTGKYTHEKMFHAYTHIPLSRAEIVW